MLTTVVLHPGGVAFISQPILEPHPNEGAAQGDPRRRCRAVHVIAQHEGQQRCFAFKEEIRFQSSYKQIMEAACDRRSPQLSQ